MRLIQKNDVCLSCLNEQIGIVHKWDLKKSKSCLRYLACTNKAFHGYYFQTKTRQKLVKLFAIHNKISDCDCAKKFGFTTISKKIERLFGIPPKYTLCLTESQLREPWYLNATNSFPGAQEQQTLLHRTIEFLDLQKFETLLAVNIDLRNPRCENVLRLALRRYCCASEPKEADLFFNMIAVLLACKFDPDVKIPTHMGQETTTLAWASSKGDCKMARLLLIYEANPYETIIIENMLVNCFGLEQGKPKGWLSAMYKANQNNSLIPKNKHKGNT
jgi:hypothetical protein